ncbi:TPA: serine hydroxymethyltransferase [Patescibacteria group bacterium]|uniref:Serine hydroxymethyltransferase n=1 Tax=candidate division Kazan bacterium GW2011_GWA1_44_22 TaxID=1620410 RepID=A0A0G1I1A0_UNCK3|nr:MAG: Serine hydroxymethyltransferase [candidate division Kazan bacterium GW2011_GWA1_44_22]HCR42206.1 serine hydroxymethyltransferase [Patescibacteria group bacterium]
MTMQQLISQEAQRQQETISLIASENYAPKVVREAVGSVLMNKYAEGYPGKRYYGGNEVIDQIELEAIQAAKKLFGADHANVQPYSGTPANLAVYAALLQPGDAVLAMGLPHGGHLSHGHNLSLSGQIYKFTHYGVDPETGLINYEEVRKLARIFKPKLIVCGATAYPREIDFVKFSEIAKEVGAYCMADISHIAGLVAVGLHQSPMDCCDVVTTTTHKTLRGPRGAIILCKKDLAEKIDKAVFPGLQGGPHENTIAAIGLCLESAQAPEFKKYIQQVVSNAKILADVLSQNGLTICTGGTDNHLVLVDLRSLKLTGKEAENVLGQCGIIVNKNMIPGDPRKPLDPSGIRLGTPAVTTRGMQEKDIEELANLIVAILKNHQDQKILEQTKTAVSKLAQTFPVPE